jgi:butyryl-CoA dehydrogenase
MVDGKVEMIPEVAEALDAFNEAGFAALLADADQGGMQLPFVIACACDVDVLRRQPGHRRLPGAGARRRQPARGVRHDEQKRLYMQPIIEGRYYGTMCLSEPQAGSSLADISTTRRRRPTAAIASPARRCGSPPATTSSARTSCTWCWRASPARRGREGHQPVHRAALARRRRRHARRAQRRALAGVNHKMGQRGSVNTFLKFGESGDCHGYLVGEPHQGLGYMFHMMNEERIGVGMGAVLQGSVGYLHSLQYARERGRAGIRTRRIRPRRRCR